jgi:hemerythrin-like domain-containing protein
MLPIGPLMEEHRVIEKLMPLIRRAIDAGHRGGRIDLRQVELIVDFVRTYADRCHHGKEENILFAALENKPLSTALRTTLNELLEEHRQGRQVVRQIVPAAEAYGRNDRAALAAIMDGLEFLAAFYPAHIQKEDKAFFLPVMDYLSDAEKASMIDEEREFDRKLIHIIYRDKVNGS